MEKENAISFLGAGKKNVVFSVRSVEVLSDYVGSPSFNCSSLSSAVPVCLRVSNTEQVESEVCYEVLKDYAGGRLSVPTTGVTEVLRADLLRLTPPDKRDRIDAAHQLLLVPNFQALPSACLGRPPLNPQSLYYTLEVKPKSAWQRPRVVGISINGERHYIHPLKLFCCRFSQMLHYDVKTGRKGADPAGCQYCPNALFFSQSEGDAEAALESLSRYGSRHIAVKRRSAGAAVSPCVADAALLHLAAGALTASGLLHQLAELQLYGTATDSAAGDLGLALDIELLHWWQLAEAEGATDTYWIVEEEEEEGDAGAQRHCHCQDDPPAWVERMGRFSPDQHGRPAFSWPTPVRLVRPSRTLAECVRQYYSAATARDVSVIVSCESAAPAGEHRETPPHGDRAVSVERPPGALDQRTSDGVFVSATHGADSTQSLTRVSVVDLDEKSHKPLEWYYERDRDITTAASLFYSRGSS